VTEHVSLRTMTREEYHAFFRMYEADPMMDPRPYRYQFTHVDKSYDYDLTRQDWYPQFGIFLHDDPVGILSLKRIDKEKARCEIGLILAHDGYKNRGIGTAALLQGIALARESYGVRRIFADTMGCNARMQHVLEKLGFHLAERIPHAYHLGTRLEDRLVYLLEATT